VRILVAAALGVVFGLSGVAAQSDLDQLMSQVLSRRDENWKKLQQYVLEERETFLLAGPGGARVYGVEREYSWFVREGFFIRSPVRADGVTIADGERRRAEQEWLDRQRRRESRRAARDGTTSELTDPTLPAGTVEDVLKQSIEPEFIQAAYFLRFKFDAGQYALVGPEQLGGRRVLKIEYYPTKLFGEGRTRPNRKLRERDDQIDEKMNKSSLVTLWIDPEERQILQYDFHNIDMDFLPGGSVVRIGDMDATMRMAQPFPGVWLPQTIALKGQATLAIGTLDARYNVEYHDYRLANVTIKVQ
jgi:hypothetical protein